MGYNSVADSIWSIFIRLAVIASETREMSRNSTRIWPYTSSRSSKVIDLGVNRKPMYDFLLVTIVTLALSAIVFEILTLKTRKSLNFPDPLFFEAPFGGDPLEFGDEIWREKTRVLGLSDGEEYMPLAFFVWHNTGACQTDGQTDRQTTCDRNTALCTKVHRAVKTADSVADITGLSSFV